MPDAFDSSLLSGYLDNELTAEETAAVKQALADNATLRQELDEIRKLRAAVAALPMPPLDGNFIDGVRQRIELQQTARLNTLAHGAPQTLKMLLSFAVAACVLLAVGWTILQNRPQPHSVVLDQTNPQDSPPQDDELLQRRQPRQAESAAHALGDEQPRDKSQTSADAMVAEAMVAPAPLNVQADSRQANSLQARSVQADMEVAGDPHPNGVLAPMQIVAPEPESAADQPLKSHHGGSAVGSPRPRPRMMLKSEPQAGRADLALDTAADAPLPLSADQAPPPVAMAPLAADFAPSAAAPAPMAADAAPRLAEATPRASAANQPRMRKAAVESAEASANSLSLEARRLHARYLLRRQISLAPSADTARATTDAAATDSEPQPPAAPRLIVSTLPKDQWAAALQWWRKRVPLDDTERKQPMIDPATQVITIAGDRAALAKLSADWGRYVKQIDGQTSSRPLAMPTAGDIDSDADADGVHSGDRRQDASAGILAIEFKLTE